MNTSNNLNNLVKIQMNMKDYMVIVSVRLNRVYQYMNILNMIIRQLKKSATLTFK